MEKEENQNSTFTDQTQDEAKEAKKPEENIAEQKQGAQDRGASCVVSLLLFCD